MERNNRQPRGIHNRGGGGGGHRGHHNRSWSRDRNNFHNQNFERNNNRPSPGGHLNHIRSHGPGPSSHHRHLRMDEREKNRSRSRSRNRDKRFPPRNQNEEDNAGHRNHNSAIAELDRAVKKARQEKNSNYWNKKVIEAEERNPNRWGHSGFKELYRGEEPPQSQRNSNFRNGAPFRRSRSRSPRSPPPNRKREAPMRRSRSPRRYEQVSLLKSLGGAKRVSPSPQNNGFRSRTGAEFRHEPRRMSEIGNRKRSPEKLKSNLNRPGSSGQSRPNSGRGRVTPISSESSQSGSRTPSPKLRTKNMRMDGKDKKSSSSSDSSSDEDVLEIHARDRRSLSGSSSSDSDESIRKKTRSSSSESESSEAARAAARKKPNKKSPKKKTLDANATNGKSKEVPKVKKTPPSASNVKKSSSTKTKDKATPAASESETDSSSDSDEEPRMTLSERFAKLSQMSTDKREFAKPEISFNEIDTKLKVVKDLRNANTKIIANQPIRPEPRIRPKSPEFMQGDLRYSSNDRRQHFERMSRDEPRDLDRPDGWSDARVRFNYYKTRGYFDDRPLTFDEYVKWEAWWYEYRDWLAGEGYYDNNMGAPPPLTNNWRPPPPPLNREERPPPILQMTRDGPPFLHGSDFQPRYNQNRPHNFNNNSRSSQNHEHYRVPISRRIGHAAGGSLIVKVRGGGQQKGNFRGRGSGRLAGRIGFRR